tara:strand:+ start:253 stop:426 length:174 start_codon:yes stop_codon:yes gene_type:complete
MSKKTDYKKAFNVLDNLYNSLFCSYQSLINDYNLSCKEDKLNEIDEIYESLIKKINH